MKKDKNTHLVFHFVLWLFIFTAFSTTSIDARKHQGKKGKLHRNKKSKDGNQSNPRNGANPPGLGPAPVPQPGTYPTQLPVFSILSFGAKADSVSDDSRALLGAWKSACKVTGGVVEIPSEFKFLIKPVTLQGPCMPNLILQIDGTVLAPPKIGSWPKSSLYQWINFKWLQNFTVQGQGTVDGQGSDWWTSSQSTQKKRSKKIPNMRPTALRFYASYDITVRNITIINSPLCHLKFDNSKRVIVNNVTISAPESSPNTDGIHLQNSQDIEIYKLMSKMNAWMHH